MELLERLRQERGRVSDLLSQPAKVTKKKTTATRKKKKITAKDIQEMADMLGADAAELIGRLL